MKLEMHPIVVRTDAQELESKGTTFVTYEIRIP